MVQGLERELMGAVDKAWLGMDRETNLMVINGVLLFDDRLDAEQFRRVFEERMVGRFPRFRQRVVESPHGSGRYYWETDPYFDIRSHIRRIALPAPGDTATLQVLVSNLMSGALDRTKPLWRIYLIEGFGSGCAVFARFHHCIADGIALIGVMLSLTDDAPDPAPAAISVPATSAAKPGLIGSSLRFAVSTTASAAHWTRAAVGEGLRAVRDPAAAFETAKSAGMMTAAGAAILARLLILPSDRPSILRGPLGTIKRVAWSAPLDLDEVKRIGRVTGGTVNDILIATLAGALRQYMLARSEAPDVGDIRAMVPVNLRSLAGEPTLGNQFGLVYLSLPVSIGDSLHRLYEVNRRMNLLKNSPEAVVVYQVLTLLGMLPGELAERAVNLFASKASAVLTNVPGPQRPIYLAGRPLASMMFWVPQSGDIGLGLSIISYNGEVTLGIAADERLVPDPQRVMDAVYSEFAHLSALVTRLALPAEARIVGEE